MKESIDKQKCEIKLDPVSVVLNLATSQRLFKAGGGTGYVRYSEVFPKQEPPTPQGYAEGSAPVMTDSDKEYDATHGKYQDGQGEEMSTQSAVEMFSWALREAFPDYAFRDMVTKMVYLLHPDTGRFHPTGCPDDPFMAYAELSCPGARFSQKRDLAKVLRSAYSLLRRTLWDALGTPTDQDRLGKAKDKADYEASRRHQNKMYA